MSTALTLLALIPELLRTIANAVSAGTTLSTAMNPVLNTAASLIEAGDSAAVELQQLTDQIKNMVALNRDPTDQEWSQLQARSNAAHAKIQAGIQGSGSPAPS